MNSGDRAAADEGREARGQAMTTKICAVCETAFTVGGGKGPKSHPVLCSAHYFRFRRGSKSWKDPSIRGVGVDLARVRISQTARDELESMFTDAKKKRPALTFHEFFDLLVTYLPDGWEEP